MSRSKIAYVLPVYWPAIGGCEIHTREIVRRMVKGHGVKVLTLINSQEEKQVSDSLWKATTINASGINQVYMDEGAEVYKISLKTPSNILLYPFIRSARLYQRLEPLSMLVLTKIFEHHLSRVLSDCSLIHSVFGGVSYLSYTALKLARKKMIPFVFTPLLHLHDESLQYKRVNYIKNREKFEYEQKLHFTPGFYHDKYWLKTCRESDALITLTEYEREFFISELKINPNKVYHVGVGPVVSDNPDPLRIRKKYGLSPRNTIVLFLGRNHELKGIEELCIASRLVWNKYPETVFFFVGPKEGRSRDILMKYKDRRIVEVGNVDLQEKTDFLSACDLLCLPSLHESFGGVFLEAWMFEKPIIGCSIPQLMEITGNGKGGFLVNLVPEEIADKIVQLIDNKNMAQQMGRWGKEKINTQYNWDTIVGKLANIYSTLMT